MVAEFLSPKDQVKYALLNRLITSHLDSVPLDHHRVKLDDGCPKCERLVAHLVPLITRGLNAKKYIRPVNIFSGCTNEEQLDLLFTREVPGETRSAAAILRDSTQQLRTFMTLVPRRKELGDTSPYFPNGIGLGLAQIHGYAELKTKFSTNPETRKKWFGVALVCE